MDSGNADSVPSASGVSSGASQSFPAGRVLPGRVGGLASPAPHGRLTSLRTRDLTLGGAFKKPKKTFEPNIHAVRKSKDELKEEIHVAPKKERREREERRRESRGRRRERPQTIQSHSIFEQGPADTVRKTGWCGAAGLCGAAAAAASPVCKLPKKEKKESQEDEDELLRKMQRDDFIDDPGLRNDANLKPTRLPLRQSSGFVKSHGPEVPPASGAPSRRAQDRAGPREMDPPSLAELLQDLRLSSREELFFMQLPDCMPARGPPAQDPAPKHAAEKPAKKDGKPEDRKSAHVKVQDGRPVLAEFPEGFLGKLQIRRSGKVELKLGDIVLDVTEGAAFSFLQQLVSVNLSEGQTGDMMVLGNVQQKLVLSPDFQALLGRDAAQQHRGS